MKSIEMHPETSQMTLEEYDKTEPRLRKRVSNIMQMDKKSWEDALYEARREEAADDNNPFSSK